MRNSAHGKNGFVTATKLGATNKTFLLLLPKILLQQLNILLLQQNVFAIPILTNIFVSTTNLFSVQPLRKVG